MFYIKIEGSCAEAQITQTQPGTKQTKYIMMLQLQQREQALPLQTIETCPVPQLALLVDDLNQRGGHNLMASKNPCVALQP
jgi:hypothetical protein